MKIIAKAALDLEAVKQAALEAMQDALETADPGSISGIGADGTSEYETVGWEVDFDEYGEFTITVEVDRTSGKFAPKDEVEEEILSAMDSLYADIDVTDHLEWSNT